MKIGDVYYEKHTVTKISHRTNTVSETQVERVDVIPYPKAGHWINAKVGKLFPGNDYKCSICGNILDFNGVNCGRGDANFCPNCGADMRGASE